MEKIKSTKTEIQKAESSTIEIQQQCIKVVNEIQKRTESLGSPLSSDQCCIYRVPDYFRKSKEEHYTPQVISIGPFHHDAYNVKLKTMEQRKLRYLKYFIRHVEDLQISLEKLLSTIKVYEESIRHCYAGTIQLKSGPFVEIICNVPSVKKKQKNVSTFVDHVCPHLTLLPTILHHSFSH